MATITVIDSIMGSGKTTHVINMINTQHMLDLAEVFTTPSYQPTKYLVVVPLLTEVERFTKACPELRFKNPQTIHGKKFYHLYQLVEQGENIVTTHALFRMLDRDLYHKLNEQGYILIIDEALECVEMYDGLTDKDRKLLFDHKMVYVDAGTRRLCWNNETHPDYEGKFSDIKKLCCIGSIVCIKDKMLLWEFPSEFLTCFKHVYVCTYLFKGSPFYAYLLAEGFDIKMLTISNNTLCEYNHDYSDDIIKTKLRHLITIYEGPMNNVGKTTGSTNPLSSSWFNKAKPEVLKKLKSSNETFFSRVAKTKANYNGWTSYSKHKTKLKGRGYTKGWIPNNAKATNDYSDKQAMAYLCNWFYHPIIKGYFLERGIVVDEDTYALSAMIQWIWRSRIRNDEPIHVFIPSDRMRQLLKDWLNCTINKSQDSLIINVDSAA